MPVHEVEKVPEPVLTSVSVFNAQRLKRLAHKDKPLSPADLVSHYTVEGRRLPKHEKSYEQGEKDKEDEKLAMEVKGVKDAEKKKPGRPKKVAAVAEAVAEIVTEAAKEAKKKATKKIEKAVKADKEKHESEHAAHAVEEAKIVMAAEKKAEKAIRKARFEKGSQEAKDHMARIRAMRKAKE